MKKLTTILVMLVIALLIVVLVLLAVKAFESHNEIKSRIRHYELVKAEQQLITDILKLKYEAAVIQSKFIPRDVNDVK